MSAAKSELAAPRTKPERILQLVGEVDLASAHDVGRRLRDHLNADNETRVVVDLSTVSFMDCAGMQPLLNAHRWLAGQNRQLVLLSVPAAVERLFTILARDGAFPLRGQPAELAEVTLEPSA